MTAAALPAYEATNVRPASALQRSNIEERTRTALNWVSGVGVGILLLGTALLIPEWHLSITFVGIFAIIIGISLLTPALTLGFMRVLSGFTRFSGKFFSPLIRLAIRDITRSLSRTSVAIAALMVAVSVIVGVGLMISSFRLTVERWLTDLLQADIFVSAPSLISDQATFSLPQGVVEQLATFPGVAQIATSRLVDVSAGDLGTIQLAAVSMDIAGEKRHYKAAVGTPATTWEALEAGGLIINEPMSNRFKLGVGDAVALFTDRGEQRFPIVAIAYDFDVQPGALIGDAVYHTYWDDPDLSSAALFVETDVDVDAKINELRTAFAGEAELMIRSSRSLREHSLAIFDRSFSITVALQVLATLVAFIGILSATDEFATGASSRNRDVARCRHDTPTVMAADASGNGVDGNDCGHHRDANRLCPCYDSDLYYQSSLFRLDAADPPTTRLFPASPHGCAGCSTVSRSLPGMARRQNAAGRCVEGGVVYSIYVRF